MNFFIASLAAGCPPLAHAPFASSVLNSVVTQEVTAWASVEPSGAMPSETTIVTMEAKIPNLAMVVPLHDPTRALFSRQGLCYSLGTQAILAAASSVGSG